MRPPCEIVVRKILPAIRTLLVKDLIERHNFSQKEVAEKLGVTQAAVSQYLSSIRGDKELQDKIQDSKEFEEIKGLSDKISDERASKAQSIKDFCDICYLMRREGTLCELHSENTSEMDNECNVCSNIRDMN